MKTRDILLLAGVGVAAFAAYQYMSQPQAPQGYSGGTMIPAGGNYSGFANTTGGPVWLQTFNGVVSVVNQLGQVLQTIPWDQFGGGSGSGAGGAAGGALNNF